MRLAWRSHLRRRRHRESGAHGLPSLPQHGKHRTYQRSLKDVTSQQRPIMCASRHWIPQAVSLAPHVGTNRTS
jgi:hypothetical protein